MEHREVKRMKSGCKHSIKLPEEILVEIVTRLPFRSIMRLKSVCKGWRELIETSYFRRVFMFAHQNSSSWWSMIDWTSGRRSYGEVVGFYGCKRYGIPPSLASGRIRITACVDGLVLLQDTKEATYSVGNPVLNQWVQLPPHPSKRFNAISLVTQVEDGVVVEYKVVFMEEYRDLLEVEALRFELYSSKTGKWIQKRVNFPHTIVSFDYRICISLNKKLHWVDEHRGAFVAYDFFATEEQQKCRVIPFPDHGEACCGRAYSTSGGFLVYISIISIRLRLWRLEEYTSDSGRWQLMQDINLLSFGISYNYFPLAIHPSENHIIYMSIWKRQLMSVNLKTYEQTHYAKSTYSAAMLSHYIRDAYWCLSDQSRCHKVFYLPQFIFPEWMASIPPYLQFNSSRLVFLHFF